jgi:hypothetical protein
MFLSPVRKTDTSGAPEYIVGVQAAPIGIRLTAQSPTAIIPDLDVAQIAFRKYRKQILSELVNHRSLFKTSPSIDSLDAITPNWGFVLGEKTTLNPYMVVISNIPTAKFPAIVDFQLKSLSISRTTIKPTFELVYIGPAASQDPVIDFSWDADGSDLEVEEVSDVPLDETAAVLTLKDPAAEARKKAAEKEKVKAALRAAEEARVAAEAAAAEFLDTYDLSDSESAFSEWLSDEEA